MNTDIRFERFQPCFRYNKYNSIPNLGNFEKSKENDIYKLSDFLEMDQNLWN